ncbi:sodium/hydrogen exchanger 9-like isoform X1, partial [Lates japonicus]
MQSSPMSVFSSSLSVNISGPARHVAVCMRSFISKLSIFRYDVYLLANLPAEFSFVIFLSISVIGLLSDLRVDLDLHTLLFGEIVLNDAVAVVLT